jgi:UDP-glucuronate 4-epimerase
VDDIVEGLVRILDRPAPPNEQWSGDRPDPGSSKAPWRIYNIGNNSPVQLTRYIAAIEDALGKTAIKEFLPLQAGDVPDTYADVEDLVREFDYKPQTQVEEGIKQFIEWYRGYFS